MDEVAERLKYHLNERLVRLSDRSPQQRLAIYNRVRDALTEKLDSILPPISQRDRTMQIRRLQQVIRELEADYRRQDEEARRAHLEEVLARRASAREAARRRATGDRVTREETGSATGRRPNRSAETSEGEAGGESSTGNWLRTQPGLSRAELGGSDRYGNRSAGDDEFEPGITFHSLPTEVPELLAPQAGAFSAGLKDLLALRWRIFRSLILRSLRLAARSDAMHYFWLICEPALQVGLIVAFYWILARTYVVDMPAFPFAVIGSAGWLMFRTVARVVMNGAGAEGTLLVYPPITRFDILFARAAFHGILYLLVLVLLMTLIWYFDFGTANEHPLLFLYWWFILWLMSFGIGLCFMALVDVFPTIRKMVPILLRNLAFVTSVAYVTEQLPPEFKFVLLWNPVTHMLQLLRSALFVEYESDDASRFYIYIFTVIVLTIGFAAERHSGKKVSRP